MGVFDDNAKRYDDWFERNKIAFKTEVEAFKAVVPEKGKGLEIGVGTGRFAEALNIGTGIDISEEMMKYAVKRNIVCIKADAACMPFCDNVFDFVLVTTTICFLKKPVTVLKEACRVMKKSGTMAVGFVDRESFLGKAYAKKESPYYKEAVFYSVLEVKTMLKKAGFKIQKVIRTMTKMPEKINSVEYPLKKGNKGGFVVIKAVKK